MSPWEDIEADPEFGTLTPQEKVSLFDDWHKNTVSSFAEIDPEEMDPQGLKGFMSFGQVKRRGLLGEPVNPDQITQQYLTGLTERSKSQKQMLADYDALEKASFALKDATLQKGIASAGDRGMILNPKVQEILGKPKQQAEKEFEIARSKFTPELEQQAKEAREAMRGERPVAVLGSDIYTDPSLTLDKEEYRKAVNGASASPEAKMLALADFTSRRDEFAKNALRVFRVAGEAPIPGMDSFASWEARQPKEIWSRPPEDKALEYLRQMRGREGYRKLLSAIGTGAVQGGADVAAQGLGLGAMVSGNRALAQKAGEVQKGAEALSEVQKLEGDASATGATTAGGVARLGVGMAPAIGAGLVTGGSLTAAALAAGAQTAGAQFPSTYNAMLEQGKSEDEALRASRGAALMSGAVTSALTALGGTSGVEALIRRSGEGFARGRVASILLGSIKEIPEELADEAASQVIESSLTNPDKPVSQVVDEFLGQAPDLALQVGLLGGAGEAFAPGGKKPPTPQPTEESEEPMILGRTVQQVLDEAATQAEESGSPLLAQAIAEQAAAPVPKAQAETAEPSGAKEPRATVKTIPEDSPAVNAVTTSTKAAASVPEINTLEGILDAQHQDDDEGETVFNSEGDRDREATHQKYKTLAEKAGLTVEEWHEQRAGRTVSRAGQIAEQLPEGTIVEWDIDMATGDKRQNKYRVEVDPYTGKKYLLDITEGTPSEGFHRAFTGNLVTEMAAGRKNGTFKVTPPKSRVSPAVNAVTAEKMPDTPEVSSVAPSAEVPSIQEPEISEGAQRNQELVAQAAATNAGRAPVSANEYIQKAAAAPQSNLPPITTQGGEAEVQVAPERAVEQNPIAAMAAQAVAKSRGEVKDGELYIYRPSGTVEAKPAPQTQPAPQAEQPAPQRDTSKPEQMTPGEYASSERDPELPKNYVLSDGNGNFVTEEKNGWFKVWRLTGTHATLAGTVGFKGAEGLAKAKARLKEVSAEMHEEKLQNGIRTKKPVSKAAVDTYGITLPEGYVKQGDLYVFQPQTTAAETQTSGVATERETDEERFQRIKNISPSQRTDEDIAFANAFSKRQKELKPQAGETTRKAFISSHTASIGGRLRKALDQGMNFRGLKGTVGSWVETLYNEGWRMALDARGNRQFTNGTEALGSSGLGKVGMNYADFLSSQPQTTAAETQTPESLRVDSGAAGAATTPQGAIESPTAPATAESIAERINRSSLSPVITYPSLVQDIKNLTDGKPARLQEVADAMFESPMQRPTAEKIARRLLDENAAEREVAASRDRKVVREMIGEEENQRGGEAPVSDDKAPLEKGEFVAWQDENGATQEGVLTKISAGRNNLGEPMSEVTLETSEVVQVPRRELRPMASQRANDIRDARAAAIKSLRGHLGKEVSVGVSAVDGINATTSLQGAVPGVQKAWIGTREDFLADESLGRAFPGVRRELESPRGEQLEGLFDGGRAFVFTNNVGVYEGDVQAAKEQSELTGEEVTPQQAAVQRVITHEGLVHRGFYALDKDTRRALFQWGAQNIYEAEMDAMAEEYGYADDWRTNERSREWIMEEILAKKIERLKAPPKSGPLKALWDILASLWRKLTGSVQEVTLKDIQDVAKVLRTALELSENNVETRNGTPIRVEVAKGSLRPRFTSPLDATLSDTAKALRLMRDGPPATPVDLQAAYASAVRGKSSAMVSLDDLFAAAKALIPSLTEAEFGQQVQNLYNDNGAYVESAESPAVMKQSADHYNVRSSQGIPATYVMILETGRPMASYRLPSDKAGKLNRAVWEAQEASGPIKDSEQTPLKDFPVHSFAQQSGESRTDAAIQIVDELLKSGVPVNGLVDAINSYELHRQLGIERDPDMLGILLAEAMRRGDPNAFKAYQVARERAGRALGTGAILHKDPRFQHLFLLEGMKDEQVQQARDIQNANAPMTADEVKRLDAEAGRTAAAEDAGAVQDALEEDLLEIGEKGLSPKERTLWEKAKYLVARIGYLLKLGSGDTKPSLRFEFPDSEKQALSKLSADERQKELQKTRAELRATLGELLGQRKPRKAAGGVETIEGDLTTRAVADMVQRMQERLNIPVDTATAIDALTTTGNLKGQFENFISDSLISKVKSALTPKQAPVKNLNSVIRQITSILADNLNLPKTQTSKESLGERALDTFGRVRSNEQMIREAWERSREGIRQYLTQRATEGKEGLTEEEAAEIEEAVDAQLDSIASSVPARMWARGQAYSLIRDALKGSKFDTNEDILRDPQAALKTVQDRLNSEVGKIGNVDPARWDSDQAYVVAAFNSLVADLTERKAKADARRAGKARSNLMTGADKKLLTSFIEQARKRSGDKAPLLPDSATWTKIFSGSPQSQEAKAAEMMEYMKADPLLANLTADEQQQLADMFARRWEQKRKELLEAKVASILKARNATPKGKNAAKDAVPKFIQAINRGELTNDVIAEEIAEKFGFEKLTEGEKKTLERLSRELQEPGIPQHEKTAKIDEMAKIIAKKTRMSMAEILSAWWVTSVLSGPRTAFTIGLAASNGAFEVLGHAVSTVLNANWNGRRAEGIAAAGQALTNYFKSWPRSIQLAWQYVLTGDKKLLSAMDPAYSQFFETGRNNPLSVGWRLSQSKNPVARATGRFMHFFEKLLSALDLLTATTTRHGMLPIAYYLNQKKYDKARVASETDLANYRKKVIDLWWGGKEPTTGAEQALVTRQSINLMEEQLAKYANVLEDSGFAAAQAAMTLTPEGLGGQFYQAVRSVANKAERSAEKMVREAERLDGKDHGPIERNTRKALAYLYRFLAYQMLNVAGLRFARFAGNKLNQSLGFIPGLGLLRKFEKDYAGPVKTQAILRNQTIGAMMTLVGYSVLKAIADEPDDDKRGWGIEGSWKNLTPDQIKQRQAAGRKQYTIHIVDQSYNYANWPVSSVLAAIGTMADRIKYSPDKWKETSALDKIATGVWAASTTTMDASSLSQLAEVFGSNIHTRDPVEASAKRASRVFGNYAGGMIPRVFKDADMILDGKMGKYDGWENFGKEIPVYRRYVGGPLLDIFGKQVEVSRTPWSREFQVQPPEREYRLLGQLNSNDLWLTPANPGGRRVGRGKRSREMTDAEQKRYVTLVGDGYRKVVLKYGDRLAKMDREAAKDLLGKLTAQVRDRAEKQAVTQQ